MSKRPVTQEDLNAVITICATGTGLAIAQALKHVSPEKVGEFYEAISVLATGLEDTDPGSAIFLDTAARGIEAFLYDGVGAITDGKDFS